MSRPRERGVALVAATATLSVLTLLAVSFARHAIVGQHLTRNALEMAQADALARSGIATALVVFGERPAGLPDRATAQWTFPRQALGDGWVEVTVEDEARRLAIDAPELPKLLAVLGLDARVAPPLAAPDRDRVIGPHLGDLARGAHLTESDLARLAPHVTTSGESAVNPNTASREVLLALTGDAALVENWLRTRDRAPVPLETAPAAVAGRLTARGQYYRVRATGGVGEARRTIEAVVRTFDGTDAELVSWRAVVGASPSS